MWGNGQGFSAPNSMAPRLFRGPGTGDSFLTQEFQQLLLSLLRNAVSSLFVSLPLLASGSGDGLTPSKQDYHSDYNLSSILVYHLPPLFIFQCAFRNVF